MAAKNDPSRIAGALKSGLENQLLDETDSLMPAGHGSHVVSAMQNLEALAASPSSSSGWSQERIDAFAAKIAKLVADEA